MAAMACGIICCDVINVSANENLGVATQCTFVIPPEFAPDTKPGLFRNKNFPMESSSIKYSIYENGKDKVLTNREKKALLASGEMTLVDESENLTKEIYQKAMSEAYAKEYGQDVGFAVTSFSKKKYDGFPGFRISSEFQPQGQMKVYQTVYIVLSKYRTFTITYQWAEDDECVDLFNSSAETIHVK